MRAPRRAIRQARDELGRLISLLDSGQDGWVMRREIGRLLEEQRAAMGQTGEVGRETAGKSADELSAPERDASNNSRSVNRNSPGALAR